MADRRGRADRIGFMRHAQPVFRRVDYLDASARRVERAFSEVTCDGW